MKFNGREYQPFEGAFPQRTYDERFTGRRHVRTIPHRRDKVTTLDAVMEVIRDGDTISYPHYYRTGDKGLRLVVEALRRHGKRDIRIYGNAFFDHVDPWLIEAVRAGVIGGIYGNVYRKFGQYVTAGELLPWVGVGFSHGDRVRKLQTGEVTVRAAFGPVPLADRGGNANGRMGKPEHLCGPVGLFDADAEYAEYVCLLAGTVSETAVLPAPVSMEQVDFVVPVDDPGLNEGIGSGTLDMNKARTNPFNAQVGENITRVIRAAGVVKDDFSFQVGSGAGLLVLENIRAMLKEMKVRANFSIGGVTSLHVDMLEEGTLYQLMHGQLFEPSPRMFASMLTHPRHHEITTAYYASVANKEAAVNLLDLAVLSALEVDLEFNLNTVCAGGRIIGGIGGGQDVAAGAALTIIFMPLATGKDGKGFPKVVDRVYTRTTPGEVVDVVVTEEYAAVNPAGSSRCKEAILAEGKRHGVKLVSIEELRALSEKKAREFGTIPPTPPATGEVVHIIEWRDGTLLDVVRKAGK
ncbi:MAG TPA: citrate lyase subunit alpha [candidate division Zixibacteria bacterium]|nr:citrate lyase subunit alpha [candidate division Zixibacteria bacterium]